MEALAAKYGFSDECINDVKKLMADCILEIVPCVIKEIKPTIVDSVNAKLKSDTEQLVEISRKRKTALKYIQDHISEWEACLKRRNNSYWQYMRCVSTLDLYTECLEEEPGMYIPRKFRRLFVGIQMLFANFRKRLRILLGIFLTRLV